jgi:outer membrane protein assembly factor BamA
MEENMLRVPNKMRRRYLRNTAFFVMFGCVAAAAQAQQFEDPGPPDGTQEEVRIVEDRPRLHFIKRTFHPLTWMDFTVRPILRLAESQASRFTGSSGEGPQKRAAVKFGVDKAGASSGIGPEITPYIRDLFGTGIDVEAPLLVTYKRYESYQLIGRVPVIAREGSRLVSLDLSTGYRSRAADNFFGLGNDTEYASRSRFRSVIREAAARLNVRLNDKWTTSVQVRHSNVGITEPYAEPSAQEAFQNAAVPGLLTGARLLSTSVAVERNTTDEIVPSRGGVHRLEAGLHEGSGRGDFSYWKYQYNGEHYFPLSGDGRKVIAIRGRVETNQEKGGSEVPFFDLPYVGGRSTIRGYDSFRFIDKTAASFGAEYRYRIWRHFDVGLFVDQGQVAPEPGDLRLDGFHTGYGARIVMRPSSKYAVSLDAGRSDERWKFYIDFTSGF